MPGVTLAEDVNFGCISESSFISRLTTTSDSLSSSLSFSTKTEEYFFINSSLSSLFSLFSLSSLVSVLWAAKNLLLVPL